MNNNNAPVMFVAAIAVALCIPAIAAAQTVQVVGDSSGEACWRAAVATTFERADSAVRDLRWKSDAIGAYPKSHPVTPADIHATVFAALGYDPHAITYQSPEGRPFPLSEGEPIRGLL